MIVPTSARFVHPLPDQCTYHTSARVIPFTHRSLFHSPDHVVLYDL